MKLAKIRTLEVEKLACHITGLDYDKIDADEETIDKNCNPNDRDYKDGGYVLTELGQKCYGAKLLARQSALSGVGGLP